MRNAEKGEGRVMSLPVLRIETPGGGSSVSLNGKIDRVDGAGRRVAVVDYKSAKEKKLELRMVYWGLTLQLPVYAVVMEMLAEREAVAALYVPLGLKRETVRQFAEAAEWGSDGFYQRQRPQGIVDAAGAEVLDHELVRVEKESIASEWYGIGFTQKGTVAKRGGMLEHGDYATVLRYVRWKIGAMGEELMRGEIGPAPYRTSQGAACAECEFSSLCPFDRASGVYRDVPAMKGEVAIERMRAAMDGGGDSGHRGTEGAEDAQREEV
jgi:ATP-dependent helicase/nuclease subunit B